MITGSDSAMKMHILIFMVISPTKPTSTAHSVEKKTMYDQMPWYIAVPLAIGFTVVYLRMTASERRARRAARRTEMENR